MPRRSSVYRLLPPDVRGALNARIAAAGFGDYAGHKAWLAEQGYSFSESALRRHGAKLQKDSERQGAQTDGLAAGVLARIHNASEIGRIVKDSIGVDSLDASERVADLCMTRLYELAVREDLNAMDLQAIARSLNASLRTVTGARARRDAERLKLLKEAAGRAADQARKSGLSPATAAAIRAAVEGAPHDEDPAGPAVAEPPGDSGT